MAADRVDRRNWELAAESIVVQLRWFGVAMGYVLVQTRTGLHDPSAVRAFLALGAGYAALDTVFHRMGEVFLDRWPLFVSLMESVFIALLCYHDTRLDSPFRWYYLLSAICAAIRYRRSVAWVTSAMHVASLATLAWILGMGRAALAEVEQMAVILFWTTWASSSLAGVSPRDGVAARRDESGSRTKSRRARAARRRPDGRPPRIAGPSDPPGEDGGLRPARRGNRPRGGQPARRALVARPDASPPRSRRLHGGEARPCRPPALADPAARSASSSTSPGLPRRSSAASDSPTPSRRPWGSPSITTGPRTAPS